MKVVASHGSYSKGCFLTPLNLTSAVIGFNQEYINPRFTAVRGALFVEAFTSNGFLQPNWKMGNCPLWHTLFKATRDPTNLVMNVPLKYITQTRF